MADNDQDCRGPIDSIGHNVVGDPTGCDIALQSSDLTGNPSLGEFIDPGDPGQGRVPLLASSRAIDSGNNATCSETDQLDTPRADGNGDGSVVCDRGAVEFYPLVNDLVTLDHFDTDSKS